MRKVPKDGRFAIASLVQGAIGFRHFKRGRLTVGSAQAAAEPVPARETLVPGAGMPDPPGNRSYRASSPPYRLRNRSVPVRKDSSPGRDDSSRERNNSLPDRDDPSKSWTRFSPGRSDSRPGRDRSSPRHGLSSAGRKPARSGRHLSDANSGRSAGAAVRSRGTDLSFETDSDRKLRSSNL